MNFHRKIIQEANAVGKANGYADVDTMMQKIKMLIGVNKL